MNKKVSYAYQYLSRTETKFFGDPYYLELLYSTFIMAILVAVLTIILAYPVAYYLVRVKSPLVRVIAVLVYLPLMASTVVTSFGWQALLADSGFINRTLMSLGIIDEPIKMMYNRVGVYIALVQANMPFMVVQIRNALKAMDPFTIQASKTMGANSFQTFIHVTLPLSMPGISAGVMLVFVSVMSSFVTPTLIGGGRVNTLGSLIYNQVTVAANLQFASAVAFIQGHMTSNSTTFVQYAAIEALNHSEESIREMVAAFEARRQYAYSRLCAMEGIVCRDVGGAFYLLPDVSYYYGRKARGKVIRDSFDLCNFLLEAYQVAMVPGGAFLSPNTVRVAYTVSMDEIREGMDRIEQALQELKP